MNKVKAVQDMIYGVGGESNIQNAWHCMTRLRFDLKDTSKVDIEKIKELDPVLGAQFNNDQFQIILGPKVAEYYNILASELKLTDVQKEEEASAEKKKGFVTLFMNIVSGVFGPIVPAIAGAGLIKGLIAGLTALHIISDQSETIQIINMMASGVFTFLPFFLAASAAKIFKTNEYLAIAIAATIMFPTMVDAAKAGELSSFQFLSFIPIPVFNYTGTVIPIIFAVWAMSYIHKIVNRFMPEVLKTVVTPTLTLFISGFLALSVIGPIGIHLGNGLAWLVQGLFGISPILAGVVVGAIRPLAVFTGMHHAMTPIALQNFATQGYDMLMPMMCMANFSIVGATFAVYYKVNTPKEKSIIVSAAVSGLLGITEPALFGVLAKYKKAFLAAIIASSVASAFISFFGVRLYGYVLSSIFSIPAYFGPYFIYAISGMIIAVALSFTICYLFLSKVDVAKANEPTQLK
ncbi:PTS system, glucose subfamily, IIA subunit [Paenibacillus terrae HPL-003]|uniref:PTS system, glucose subfamily, IIA subunit n=1 Tax=Paenibacillus terrae (strain HPL-003) TaxID=985665 RepID=G7VPH0_PAETH|nr:PTS transporter subunit EIIC [Paenibacillus terrae]AET61691.1 PTS system, glucose subfamily, IIA subunit [Paenibacillus terrae HPL-003]